MELCDPVVGITLSVAAVIIALRVRANLTPSFFSDAELVGVLEIGEGISVGSSEM